jgi:hypothetical protein
MHDNDLVHSAGIHDDGRRDDENGGSPITYTLETGRKSGVKRNDYFTDSIRRESLFFPDPK